MSQEPNIRRTPVADQPGRFTANIRTEKDVTFSNLCSSLFRRTLAMRIYFLLPFALGAAIFFAQADPPPAAVSGTASTAAEQTIDNPLDVPNIEVPADVQPPPASDTGAPVENEKTGVSEPQVVENPQSVPAVDVDGIQMNLFGGAPPVKVVVTAEADSVYDDNISISHQKQGDFYEKFSAGVYAGWGDFRAELLRPVSVPSRFDLNQEESRDYFFIGYCPSETLFAHYSDQDSFNQAGMLHGRFDFSQSTLTLDAQVQTLSDADLDLGRRVNRTVSSASAVFTHQIDDRMAFDTKLDVENVDYDGGDNSTDVSLAGFLAHNLDDKTQLAAGANVGYLTSQDAPNQFYEQALGRINYNYSDKLAFEADAGVEFREFKGGIGEKTQPVFNLTANYQASEYDLIVLNAGSQTVNAASSPDENIDVINLGLSISHQLFQRIYLTLSGGYQNMDYQELVSNLGPDRTDNYFYLGLMAAFEVTPWAEVQLSYQYQNDKSTIVDRTFDRNIAELRMNLRY